MPDLRDVENPLAVQKGDVVEVPIPLSSPTFVTGLIGAGARWASVDQRFATNLNPEQMNWP